VWKWQSGCKDQRETSEDRMVALDPVQFVVDQDGQPVAVQVDMQLWRQIIALIESAENISLAREALVEVSRTRSGPERAGWTSLMRDSWLGDGEP
jgi:hypothetical protein